MFVFERRHNVSLKVFQESDTPFAERSCVVWLKTGSSQYLQLIGDNGTHADVADRVNDETSVAALFDHLCCE